RLHAFAHAWASDSATEVTIEVAPLSGAQVEVSALVAEPGPLVAMKLQAIMNRGDRQAGHRPARHRPAHPRRAGTARCTCSTWQLRDNDCRRHRAPRRSLVGRPPPPGAALDSQR